MMPAMDGLELKLEVGENGGGGIPPLREEVSVRLVPAVIPELRRVALSASARPMSRT